MLKQKRNRKTFTERTGYPAKILELGYLGEISPAELKVIKRELQNRSKLRSRWGFAEGENITDTKIQEKALGGSLDDDEFSPEEDESDE